MNKSLGEKIKELRQERDISQKTFAKNMNLTQANISRLETGEHTTTIENLVKIADYFKVSTDYLLGRVDEFDNPIQERSTLNHINVKSNIRISNSFNGNMHKN